MFFRTRPAHDARAAELKRLHARITKLEEALELARQDTFKLEDAIEK